MSGLTTAAAGVGTTAAGVKAFAGGAAPGPISEVASGALAVTGIAVAVYVAVALGLIASGFILRRFSRDEG